MSIVLYIGGSKDGMRGVMPYGFTKTMLETENGCEIYVERMIPLQGKGTVVRVMALESIQDDALANHVTKYYTI
ncbi:MAG: hypothetical protein LBV45_00145 [Xanthomonadaceae bacterium]|jgi:hypothetical protein|nr:hypothetical protein [Xanthomonadaceae bacterium]